MIRTLAACALLMSVCAIPACIAIGGTEHSQRPTTGQELLDLQTALQRGALTQAEYDQKKAQILSGK